jgi:membrane protein
MYLVIPHTRVRMKSALLGAVIASVLWELGKYQFANSIGQSVRYSTIYGSLAVFPIFLIWLYITWIIVLLGLEIAFTHQHFPALLRSSAAGDRDVCDRVTTGLQIFALIAQRFHKGLDPPTSDDLSRRFLLATGAVDSHLERLSEAGLVRAVTVGSGAEGVVPARSLESVRIVDVIAAFDPVGEDELRQRPIELEVEDIVASFREAGYRAVGETTFSELVPQLDRTRDAT